MKNKLRKSNAGYVNFKVTGIEKNVKQSNFFEILPISKSPKSMK